MSTENVEVVRTMLAAWNRGDMDAVRDLLDPDAVMQAPEGWPEPGPEVGRDAVMRQFERLRGAWEADFAEAVTDFVAVDDRVVVRLIWHTRGHGPGTSLEITLLATVRNRQVVRNEYYRDHAEALAVADLAGGGEIP